jgi:transposase
MARTHNRKGKPGKPEPLKVVHPDCAGIDIGSREHWVAIDPARCAEPVCRFEAFTDGLEALADWLTEMRITTVAMEATGVYWIPLFELLDRRGFEVYLVNSRATRQTSGRKSDVLDCQWIWQLMSYGLLRGAFRPNDKTCELRALVRQRATKGRDQSRTALHMQKALTQMNVLLANVVSDITGKTGLAILRQIVAGERDPKILAALRDRRLKANEVEVARSLHGNWRSEHLLALSQALAHFDFLATQIAQCDVAIASALGDQATTIAAPPQATKPLRDGQRSSTQQTQLHQALYQVLGVDLTAIPTIALQTTLVIAAEIGPDLSRFPDSDHFCSWLSVAPDTRISGGKPLPGRAPKRFNRAGQALRQAAANARNSQSFIGAAHRARLRRMNASAAIKATAHQLARLIYSMLTRGQAYVERGIDTFQAITRDKQLHSLRRKAAQLGVTLVLNDVQPTVC